MAERITIAELDIDVEQLIARSAEAQRRLTELRTAQRDLTRTNQTGSAEFQRNAAQIRNLSSELRNNQRTIAAVTTETGRQVTVEQRINQELQREVRTIQQAREQNSRLTQLRNQVNVTTEQGRNALSQVNNALDENNEFIRENVSGLEQQRLNIGSYEQSVVSALNQVNLFGVGLGDATRSSIAYVRGLQAQRAAQVATTGATAASSTALRAFRIALISTGIGAIVVAIGTLVAAFASTQAGSDRLTRALAPVREIFQVLIGFAQNLGTQLVDFVTNPIEGIQNFGRLIQENIENRIQGAIDLVGNLGSVLSALFEGDLRAAGEAFEAAGESYLQTITGIEDLPSRASNFFGEVSASIDEATERARRMADLQVQIEEGEISLTRRRAELNFITREQNRIGEDINNNIRDREAAVRRAAEAQSELLRLEEAQLQQQLTLRRLQTEANDTSREDLQEIANLEAQIFEAQTRNAEIQTTLGNRINTIRQQGSAAVAREQQAAAREQQRISREEAEQARANAEFAITLLNDELEAFIRNNQAKVTNNQLINDEIFNQETRRINSIADQERNINRVRFESGLINLREFNREQAQIDAEESERINQLQIDRNDARREQEAIDFMIDQELAAERGESQFQLARNEADRELREVLREASVSNTNLEAAYARHQATLTAINQQEEQQRLDIANETFGGIAELLGEQTAAGKAAAIAQATINTYQGVTEVWRSPSILPEPFATAAKVVSTATVLGSGLQAVRSITSTSVPQFEKGGLIPIGGNRHSQGGTMFYGEDGTTFEAERGELIGVMSRQASQRFMAFNNRYTPNSGSSGNYFQNGGIVERTISTPSRRSAETLEAISNINIQSRVAVTDIIDGLNDRDTLVTDANI